VIVKTYLGVLAAAVLLLPSAPANAGRDEAQMQQHRKFVEAQRKQQAAGIGVAGRPGDARAAREGRPACPGIGWAHPKRAYNC
jgi:hypothetical protein